jgi:hypothetical protein
MTVNLTDTSTFTDPIVAPNDGDPANGAVFQVGLQGLANRTRQQKNRLDAIEAATQFGRYLLASGVVGTTTKVPLTLQATQGLTIVADAVVVPVAALYLIDAHISGELVLGGAEGDPASAELRINGVLYQVASEASSFGGSPRRVHITLGGVYALAANDAIDVRTGSTSLSIATGYLSVARIK